MKIGHNADTTAAAATATPGPTAANDAARDAVPATATPTAIPATADPSARIAISSEATSLLSGQASADFDTDKVARISQQIENKTFKINPEAIADKLISNARELLTKT